MVRSELPNGLRIIVKRNSLSPSVAVRLCIHSGTLQDPAGSEGTALATSILLEEGTRKRTGRQIAEMIDFIGADLGVTVDKHSTLLLASLMKNDLDSILKLALEILTEPVFPQAEMSKVTGQLISNLREDENDTRTVALKALRGMLYSRSHPYRRPGGGTRKSIRTLKKKELVRFHKERYHPAGGILIIVGDVKERETLRKASAVFGRWKRKGDAFPPPAPDAVTRPSIQIRTKEMVDKTQNDIALGFVGIRRSDPDFYNAVVLNQILGAFGLGGRLGNRIREEAGLAYYVYSSISPSVGPGPFIFRAGVHPDHVSRAVTMILEEIDRVRQLKVSKQELDETRQFLIGSLPLRLETNEGIAAFMLNEEYNDLGPDYLGKYGELINGVTREGVLGVARRLLRTDAFSLSVAGPALPAPLEESIGNGVG